jgi:pimeloyl-ACP methyl ester carboxylesterase
MPICHMKDLQLFYEDHGSGTPIIFIHPPGMGRKVFFYQLLLANHFRIIVPDLSGHGDSSRSKGKVTIAGFSEEIKGLMDVLNIEKAVICGYSSGGIIAQEFSLNNPERVIGVILAGGFPKLHSPLLKYEHLIGMYLVKRYPRLLINGIALAHTEFTPLKKALVTHMLKADRKVWFEFYEQSLHFDCQKQLENWNKPLMLVYGSKDLFNQHIREYEKRLDVQIAVIKKAAHQVPMKNWQTFNQLITGFTVTHSK